jgi:Lamin Tail Domain
MRRSFTALVTAGIAALSLVTGTAAASTAPQSTANVQRSCTVVIDQFATHGPAGQDDQYIQLQNISQAPQDLSNFTIEASIGSSRFRIGNPIPWGTVLQPAGVWVIANGKGFTGSVANQYWMNITLPDLVGIGLLDPLGHPVDGVATDPRSPHMKGAAAPRQPPGPQPLALVRVSNTDNNAADFHIMPRTPGVRSHVPPC